MKKKLIISTILLLLTQCKYTGGYDIVKGSKAIEEINEKLTQYSFVGTLYYLSAFDSFTCPSASSAKIVTETEDNGTYKKANQFDFPSEDQSTRLQGTITTGNSDYDIFYMIVPSDTTYTKFYNKGSGCTILINSDGSELNNDTYIYNADVTKSVGDTSSEGNSENIQPSDYVFFFCNSYKDGSTYDVQISVTEIASSTSSSSDSTEIFSSTEYQLSSVTLGPTVFEISSGIDKSKYYTRSSVDECKENVEKKVSLASILDGYNLLLYVNCGASYKKINPYFVGGSECKLQEADWIQIGDLGIP